MARLDNIGRVWATLHNADLTGFSCDSVRKVRGQPLYDVVLKTEEGQNIGSLSELERVFKSSATTGTALDYSGCPCCEYDGSLESSYLTIELPRSTLDLEITKEAQARLERRCEEQARRTREFLNTTKSARNA